MNSSQPVVCQSELCEFLAKLSEFATELSECMEDSFETVFRPFPWWESKIWWESNLVREAE